MSPGTRSTLFVFLALWTLWWESSSAAVQDDGKARAGLFESLELRGVFKNETAYRLGGSGRLAKTENLVQLEAILQPRPDVEITAVGRAIFAPVNLLENVKDLGARPLDRFESGDSFEAELREFYLDIFTERMELRLGKQQVVWGKADGLRVLDVINPQEFREFILDDFIDARIPLWMVKGNFYPGRFTLEAIWIPDFEANRPAQPGTEFSTPFSITAPAGVDVVQLPTVEPSDGLSTSEAGLRISGFYRGWDFTVNYFYTWDDDPAFFSSFDPFTNTLFFKPHHQRIHVTGFTFSTAAGPAVLRGEFGCLFNKPFAASTPQTNGIIKKNFINYVMGVDYTAHPRVFISGQLFHQIVNTSRNEDLLIERSTFSLSMLVRTDFLHETLTTEMLILWNTDKGDYLIRPKISYQATDQLRLTLALDIFGGDSFGFFGRFAKKDRIFTEISYRF